MKNIKSNNSSSKKSVQQEKRPNVWLSSLKITAKIIICVFSLFSLVVASLFYLVPSADIKIFNFLGATKAEERCYERIYAKTGSTSDLYNLIIFEMEHENSEKELEYIKKIYEADDYKVFCAKLNKSGIVSADGNKSLYAYVADTEAFLMGQEMKCTVDVSLSKQPEDWQMDIVSLIQKNIQSENLTENSFYTFSSMIYKTDKLALKDKSLIMQMLSLILIDDARFEDLVIARRNSISLKLDNLNKETDVVQEILLTHSIMQWYSGLYYYDLMLNQSETTRGQDYKKAYEETLQKYNNLIK